MPTTVHSRKYLYELLGYKPSDKELEEDINMLGMSLERKNEKEIEVEFQANRPDLISTVGLARLIKYFENKTRAFGYKLSGESGVVITTEKLATRKYIASLLAEGSLSDESLLDLIRFTDMLSELFGRHRKKIAIGLHNADAIKGNLRYAMYEDEEFEALGIGKTSFSRVLKESEKGKAYGKLCYENGKYYALKDDLGTIALIPIINSERTRISITTKRILVDITGINPVDVNSVANLIASNFMDMGFKVYSVGIKGDGKVQKTPTMKKQYVLVPLALFSEELGIRLAFNNVISLANRVGIQAALLGRRIRFTIPPYRLDIMNYQDIVEEIAIAYGYDYIQPLPVPSMTEGSLDKEEERNNELRSIMAGLGFFETLSSYTTSEKVNFELMRHSDEPRVRIKNAKSSNITMLRTWLIPSLLMSLSKSQHEKLPHKIFELDMVFSVKDNMPIEKNHIACVSSDSEVDMNEMKSIALALVKSAYGMKAEIVEREDPSFIPGRCAAIKVDGKEIGLFGEIHPQVLTNFGIENPTLALELSL